jgi:hypothetical protein
MLVLFSGLCHSEERGIKDMSSVSISTLRMYGCHLHKRILSHKFFRYCCSSNQSVFLCRLIIDACFPSSLQTSLPCFPFVCPSIMVFQKIDPSSSSRIFSLAVSTLLFHLFFFLFQWLKLLFLEFPFGSLPVFPFFLHSIFFFIV